MCTIDDGTRAQVVQDDQQHSKFRTRLAEERKDGKEPSSIVLTEARDHLDFLDDVDSHIESTDIEARFRKFKFFDGDDASHATFLTDRFNKAMESIPEETFNNWLEAWETQAVNNQSVKRLMFRLTLQVQRLVPGRRGRRHH